MSAVWNPAHYLKNAGPRLKPAIDLLNRAVLSVECSTELGSAEAVKSVLDLGCGPGNVTPYLQKAFPNAKITGIDASGAMVEAAKAANSHSGSGITFSTSTIQNILQVAEEEMKAGSDSAGYDVVYSNAALHWVDNHETVFPQIMNYLVRKGGVLAVQMPDTRVQPSHTLIEDACVKCGFKKDIKHVRIPRVDRNPSYYYDILHGMFSDLELWSTEYVQQLPSLPNEPHPVLSYVSATGLMPILDALGGPDSDKSKVMLTFYEKLLYDAYSNRFLNNDGTERRVLFPFKRFFMVARK